MHRLHRFEISDLATLKGSAAAYPVHPGAQRASEPGETLLVLMVLGGGYYYGHQILQVLAPDGRVLEFHNHELQLVASGATA